MTGHDQPQPTTLFGHPTGLFTLFFAEMWERFSFYGMKALLLFYMIKGFLGYSDRSAYSVLGAYAALVYMTPFFGGMIADQLIGGRRAVILGGLLMAAGHLMMTMENDLAFFTALGLLITGNGFFKPNISTIVGSLYPEGSTKRDGGFTIFYMGVNLGAGIAPLLCGYVGETLGWHYGFGLATVGMVAGIAVFVAPSVVSQLAMFLVSLAAAYNIFVIPTMVSAGSALPGYFNAGVFLCLVLVGFHALWQLGRGGLKESVLSMYIARIVIIVGVVVIAWALMKYRAENPFSLGTNALLAGALVIAGIMAWVALGRGGLPKEAGAPADPDRLRRPVYGLPAEWWVYLGSFLAVPVFALLVSGFAPMTLNKLPISLIDSSVIDTIEENYGEVAAVFLREMSRPAGLVLLLCGVIAFAYVGWHAARQDKAPRQRMYVVFILTFFAVLFWSFFEQAASSINNFTDRNVDRVLASKRLSAADVGRRIQFRLMMETADAQLQPLPVLGQEQLGHQFANDSMKKVIGQAFRLEEQRKARLQKKEPKEEDISRQVASATKDNVFTITALTYIREAVKNQKDHDPQEAPLPKTAEWEVTSENIGMGVGGSEIPATVFLGVNPIYILLFGMVLTGLWSFLGARGLEPSTPVKFALGILQLGLAFVALWYGAQNSDQRGMVAIGWLLVCYLLLTTGELCLSPVGLSMVTKLSPKYLVSTVMGIWFLATAFSEILAAIIAQFTGVGHGDEGSAAIPIPKETVHVYGDVFGNIAVIALSCAVICFALSPLLRRWMHEEKQPEQC